MRWDSVSQAGRTSQGDKKKNQDASLCGSFPLPQEELGYFLVVADGMGSKSHSDKGARAFCQAVKEVLNHREDREEIRKPSSFLQEVHRRWLEKLEGYLIQDCGCTALMALVFPEEVLLFRLGDGFLSAVWTRESKILWEDKGGQGKFLNETEALQEEFLLGLWEIHHYPRQGLRGIIACTDGIEIGEGSLLDYDNFSQEFLRALFPLSSLQEELEKLVTVQENRDDKTVACLLEDWDVWKQSLQENHTVYEQNGTAHTCTDLLSYGGQGAVYRTENPNMVVKFVFDGQGEKDWRHLEKNQCFLDLRLLPTPPQVTIPCGVLADYVGYTMELLEDMASFEESFSLSKDPYTGGDWFLEQHKAQEPLVHLLYNYKKTGGLRRRLLAYYHLSCIFLELHSHGLVFGDFSPKNVFLSTSHGYSHVWLIDVDNLDYERNHQKKRGYYTPAFVAPEVAKQARGCSSYSDNYSFALALFLQLTGTHPFSLAPEEEEEEAQTLLSFEDFADNISLKQRDRGELEWILTQEEEDTAIPHEFILSPKLHQLFAQSFSQKGKEKPMSRATSFQWQEALGKDLDTAIHCPNCGMDYHYQGQDLCPWCDHKVPLLQVQSFLEGDRVPLWTLVQARVGKIPLPLRLIPDQQEAQDFQAVLGYGEEQTGEFLLSSLHPQFQYEVLDAQGRWGKYHRNFGCKGQSFQLICERKDQIYRLELSYL